MKISVEIEIPNAKEYCVSDKFKFTEFIAKTLTRKWFGCGCFSCKIINLKKDI